jgi:hypothetical protein
MVNFDLSYTTDAGAISQPSKIYSEPNGQRVVDWIWVTFRQYEADGVTLKPRTQANEVQSFRDFADDFYADTKRKVLRSEEIEAAETAIGNVPPLEPEP